MPERLGLWLLCLRAHAQVIHISTEHGFLFWFTHSSFYLAIVDGCRTEVFVCWGFGSSPHSLMGCASDGQVGPEDAPRGQDKLVRLTADEGELLAYYQSSTGPGVLGPRGWSCFGTYGSASSTLYLSPKPIDGAKLFSSNWRGSNGPAIQITREYGGTSGRFEVARIIARVFPAHRSYVQRVLAEGTQPQKPFPSGPYPKDKLTYKGQEIVEYITPPHTDGLGTVSYLAKGEQAIIGSAILTGPSPDVVLLSVRLPQLLRSLASPITQQVECEAAQIK